MASTLSCYGCRVLRRVFTLRWLGALLLAALWSVAAYHLGHWQYDRHLAKVERNERIDAHYGAAPVPLTGVLAATPLPLAAEWTHVTATGTYGEQRLVVRGRTVDGEVGYEVLAPFRVDGAIVVVDRGWISQGQRGASDVPVVAPPPAGEVTLTGWVRVGEQSRGKASTPGQVASINLADISAAIGEPVLGGYVILERDSAPAGVGLTPTVLGKPDKGLGPHQAYAYQWWMTMPLGFVLIYYGLRRERDADEDALPGAPARPAKPKKVRIWDEEDA